MIELKHARFEFTEHGCTTHFPDGTSVDGHPHWNTPHYFVIAHRVGNGDDLLAYVRDHELLHSLVNEWMFDRPSPVLQAVAHGKPLSGRDSAFEECFVQTFQAFMRGNQRPIVSGLPKLDEWKREALWKLDQEDAAFRQIARAA